LGNAGREAEVVVVGAGPGGSAAAYYLARAGVDVLLVDRAAFPRDKTCGDCVSARALAVLAEMGLPPDRLEPAGRRVSGLEIVAPNGATVTAPVPAVPPRGPGRAGRGAGDPLLILPRKILDDRVRLRALEAGARYLDQTRVLRLEREAGEVVLHGERLAQRPARGGVGARVELRARLAVVATGGSSGLLVRSGILPAPPPVGLAARVYVHGLSGLGDRVHLSFEGTPLPGYGWVFPLSETEANVGVGFPAPRRARSSGGAGRGGTPSPQTALAGFLSTPRLRGMLAGARRVGPVKGYPLRMDFAEAPTFAPGVLLVGEAAGLVNPLSGEGIDYALESGRIAAEHGARLLASGDLSTPRLAAYDAALRRRFQDLQVFCRRVGVVCRSRRCLDALVWAARRHSDLRTLLVEIVLGYHAVPWPLAARPLAGRRLGSFRPGGGQTLTNFWMRWPSSTSQT
jgi:geranylgeranyl reductase family protein